MIVTRKDIRKLIKRPKLFALMMNDKEIEEVIVNLVCVKQRRCNEPRGDPQ